MRMLQWIGALIVLLVITLPVRAETPAAQSPKIAVLDWRAALLGTEQARNEFRAIREALSQDEQEIKTLADDAQALQARLQQEADQLSDDEKRQLSKEVQEKAEEYQFLGQRLQKEQRQRQESYIRRVRPQLDDAVRRVIQAQKIDLLLDRQAVTFVAPQLDITALVIAQLNEMQAQAQ